ncbi:hypothetical protein [Alkalimarinus alittae]|uniref:Uncharacterized protein n=1 Tax=Alkalimarinus alittae TaxID=2961619 RepID=A0ABY6MZQ0_9ALTE|nr:hypothetical protein [Alkalimarinus alittae]UZE95326.1 hypothetical protein NKI27_14820 [Alkalimarinus alittae]
MNSKNAIYCELSLNELDLSVRIIKAILNFEYDEFWCITMCTREELTMIIGIFQLAKNKLNENGDLAQIKLEFAQYMIFTRALGYVWNFEDFFEHIFNELEFDEIDKLNEKVRRLYTWSEKSMGLE